MEQETEGYLCKNTRRRDRRVKSEKIRARRRRIQSKRDKDYEDGFGGNYDNDSY